MTDFDGCLWGFVEAIAIEVQGTVMQTSDALVRPGTGSVTGTGPSSR